MASRDDSTRTPGWYPDPHAHGTERWWNGISWSDSRRPAGGGPVSSTTGPSSAAITYAAAPSSTVTSLSGNAAPAAARSRRRGTTVMQVVVLLIALVALFFALTSGAVWLGVITLFLAIGSFGGAQKARARTGVGVLALLIGIAVLIVGASGIRLDLGSLLGS